MDSICSGNYFRRRVNTWFPLQTPGPVLHSFQLGNIAVQSSFRAWPKAKYGHITPANSSCEQSTSEVVSGFLSLKFLPPFEQPCIVAPTYLPFILMDHRWCGWATTRTGSFPSLNLLHLHVPCDLPIVGLYIWVPQVVLSSVTGSEWTGFFCLQSNLFSSSAYSLCPHR